MKTDLKYMQLALEQAELAAEAGEVPVGQCWFARMDKYSPATMHRLACMMPAPMRKCV